MNFPSVCSGEGWIWKARLVIATICTISSQRRGFNRLPLEQPSNSKTNYSSGHLCVFPEIKLCDKNKKWRRGRLSPRLKMNHHRPSSRQRRSTAGHVGDRCDFKWYDFSSLARKRERALNLINKVVTPVFASSRRRPSQMINEPYQWTCWLSNYLNRWIMPAIMYARRAPRSRPSSFVEVFLSSLFTVKPSRPEEER